jgi:hypothetical protein
MLCPLRPFVHQSDASALTKSSLVFVDMFSSLSAPPPAAPAPASSSSPSSSSSVSSSPHSSSSADHHHHPALATAAADFSSDDALDQFARMQRQQQRLAGGDAGVDDSDSLDEIDASTGPSSASTSARHPSISAAEAYAAAARATTPLQDDLDELDRQVRAMRVRMDGRMDEWVWMGVCMSLCVNGQTSFFF